MKHISQNPRKFAEALKQGLRVACDKDGRWFVEGQLISFIRTCFRLEGHRISSLAYALEKEFNKLERIPIVLDGEQPIDFHAYVEAARVLCEQLKEYSPETANRLEQQRLALQYRLESLKRSNSDKSLLEILKKSALDWKNNQSIMTDKTLNREELERLEEVSTYEDFTHLLLKDSILRYAFFEWILRDKNPVAPFIQYPFITSRIVESALNGRIGRLGGTHLQILKSNSLKILALMMEGRFVSLLNEEQRVTFRGDYELTIREIFEIFKNKQYKVGNLEFMEEGIVNWNVHHLGYWDAATKMLRKIDFEREIWWNQLPIFERLTRRNASRRYGINLDGIQWVVAARATRGTPTLDYDKTHAFMEVAIPQEDGSYAIYDFGKFAYQFPSSFFNSLLTFCLNMHATIAYPDENIFYSHRQHGCYPFQINPSQGRRLMDLVKRDMIKAREYNLVFQIESENCAKWLFEKLTAILGDKLPNMFKMSLMKTEPVGFVGACFNILRKLRIPELIQFRMLTWVHIPFGSGVGTRISENGTLVVKTLESHDFWQTSIVYLPAFLIEQIEKGIIKTLIKAEEEWVKLNKKSFIKRCADRFRDVVIPDWDNLEQVSEHKTLILNLLYTSPQKSAYVKCTS